MGRVAIFHWGEPSIHVFYLLEQLLKKELKVDVYQYLPRKANRKMYKKEVLNKIRTAAHSSFFLESRFADNIFIKLGKILNRLGIDSFALEMNAFLPNRTRNVFSPDHYDYVITVEQAALYWLYRTEPSALKKTFHYSLEIQKESDPHFITPLQKQVLKWERTLLNQVHGIIIQDCFRAEALLDRNPAHLPLQCFYIPVSVPGNSQSSGKSNFFHNQFKIDKENNVLLYFGANFQERQLHDLTDVFSRANLENWILIFHGPDNFSHSPASLDKIKVSNNLLSFDELNEVISSATIGLAFYDNGWPNTRYTAFSSEKVARYLQAGVPFIAYRNESYDRLKAQFNCCELIETVEELPKAIEVIEKNYALYRKNALLAFETLYNFDKTMLALTNYLKTTVGKSIYILQENPL